MCHVIPSGGIKTCTKKREKYDLQRMYIRGPYHLYTVYTKVGKEGIGSYEKIVLDLAKGRLLHTLAP